MFPDTTLGPVILQARVYLPAQPVPALVEILDADHVTRTALVQIRGTLVPSFLVPFERLFEIALVHASSESRPAHVLEYFGRTMPAPAYAPAEVM